MRHMVMLLVVFGVLVIFMIFVVFMSLLVFMLVSLLFAANTRYRRSLLSPKEGEPPLTITLLLGLRSTKCFLERFLFGLFGCCLGDG